MQTLMIIAGLAAFVSTAAATHRVAGLVTITQAGNARKWTMSADVDGIVTGTGNFPDISIALTDTLTSAKFTGSLGNAHNFLIKDETGTVVAGDTTKGGIFTFDWTPSAAGIYTYYCGPHSGTMNGKITVTTSASPRLDKATVKAAVGDLLAAAGVDAETADALKIAIEAMDEEAFAAVLDVGGDVVMSAVLANEDVVAALTDAGVDPSDIALMASLGTKDDAPDIPTHTSGAAPTALGIPAWIAHAIALALAAAGAAV